MNEIVECSNISIVPALHDAIRISTYTERPFLLINSKTMLKFSILRLKVQKSGLKSSIIRILMSKSNIAISVFEKIIRKIGTVNIKYYDSFLRRFTIRKNDIPVWLL